MPANYDVRDVRIGLEVTYTEAVLAFLSPAAILAISPHQSTPREGVVRFVDSRNDFAVRPQSSAATSIPSACPVCQSSSIATSAKSPDANSYWRCATCGEVWNVARWHRAGSGPPAWR